MTKKKVVVPDRFAIMAVDPGGTSGVAFGLLNAKRNVDGTLRGLLKRAVKRKAIWTTEAKGEAWEQAWYLGNAWAAFHFRCVVELGIDAPDVHLVLERFQLRNLHADLAPVSVTHALMALLYKMPYSHVGDATAMNPSNVDEGFWPLGEVEFQEPSVAKRYATNQRLRDWGVWVVGSEHKRDATRHLCVKASELLG